MPSDYLTPSTESQPTRRVLVVLVGIALLGLIGLGYTYWSAYRNAQTGPDAEMQKILDSLTAPEGEARPVPQEVLTSLTAPSGTTTPEVNPEVGASLTAPQ